ncbi:hypothetical protein [Paenibacillus sp. MMS20-IR301]|uniref:hypothetical protein n=1 Tax=Paenibacillus sp. MMS20-IR301 TaxID=2895946 RepID=UPI0028E5AF8F|nr:hypothetical protein [Paenibacillus sp. MMS20-IR301]WNS41016.1 hypothetical protein LOS79_18385 [Paenibacillus sp. MMS20-IR301]
MKKILILIFVVALLTASFAENREAVAAEVKSATVSVPLSTGLIGNDNAVKSFSLDLPSGVATASINIRSFEYSGNNQLNGNATVENGKIVFKLNGVANTKMISNVSGYRGSYEAYYITNPSNSIWRYSDGIRWQINEYDEATNGMKTYDKPAEDNVIPSTIPPRTVVSAAPLQSMDYLKWYDGSQTSIIDSQYIVANTITPHFYSELSSSYIKETPKFKNGKVIVNYAIPFRVESSGQTVRQSYTNQAADASHPLVGHAEGRKYEVKAAYYYTAEAKVPTYSYSGSISFSYSPPTEPTLDGRVSVVAPSPNPAKDEGKDIPVTLKISGDLLAYTDTSNIMEWEFKARESNVTKDNIKKDGTKSLSSSRAFDNLVIPKAKFAGGDFEQEYTVTVTVRFIKPVTTPSGSVGSLSKTMTAKVGVSKTPADLPTAPSGGNKPPVAVLDIPDSVMAGQEFLVYGKDSYDPDGVIVSYKYTTTDAVEPVTGEYGYTWYPLSQVGKRKSINLQVKDNGGLGNATSAKLEVTAPVPTAAITILGTKKENRKITLHNASTNLAEHFPIDESKTKFTIQAVSGGTAAGIKYSGTLTGTDDKDIVIKKAGTYKATVTVENNVGYSDVASIIFEVAPDEPPVVYFSAPNKIYRDPANGNIAPAALTDMSFSPDYDFIGHRKWEYRYDAENDGDFTNNSWVTFSDTNLSALTLSLSKVGRYEVRLTVTEEFDQPTIEAFVSAADRNSRDSYSSIPPQPLAERVIEVYNRAPVVDWAW